MKFSSLVLMVSSIAFAQGKPAAPSRVYSGTQDEVFEAAMQAAQALGLDVTKAPDASLFLASPNAWTRPLTGLSFTRTLIVHVRPLAAKETEVFIEEDAKVKEPSGPDRIALFHDRLSSALGDIRPKKALIPRHPLESPGDGTLIKQSELGGLRPLEDKPELRSFGLAPVMTKAVATNVWKVAGNIPLNFTPLSERRFVVLEGSLRMSVGTKTFWVGSGDFVLVPKAVRMAVEVDPSARATVLVVESPTVDESKTVWLDAPR